MDRFNTGARLVRACRAAVVILVAPGALLAQASPKAASKTASAQRAPSSTELPRHYSGKPTGPAITAADLMTRLYIFADDSMMGRLAGTEYNDKGTAYIEREVRRLGLEPGGENGGYFQSPLILTSIDSSSALEVGGTSYHLWTDFAPRNQGPAATPFDGDTVVFAGTYGDSAHYLAASAAQGKVVLLALGLDSTGARDWARVNRAILTAHFHDAAAIAVVQLDYDPPGYVQQVYANPQMSPKAAPGSTAQPSYFYVTKAVAQAMLGTDAEKATVGTVGHVIHGRIAFKEATAPGRNVIAILRGADPALRGEYVAIGAHDDHIGFNNRPLDHDSVRAFNQIVRPEGADSPRRDPTPEEATRIRHVTDSLHALHGGPRLDSIFNGADDDGSGSVSVLEIAEAFATAKEKPRRSMLFIWHVGEEEGMLGSGYFTDNPTVPRDSIVAELNIDMIGRGASADITGTNKDGGFLHGGPGYVQLVGARRLSTELGELAETMNAGGKLKFDYAMDANGHPQNIYCRSDHWSYARWGIPIIFFTTGGHADYHQVTDEPQYIDYPHMASVATFVHDLGARVANLDHRVAVDHAKPDPQGSCRQ